jgi:hypothetical protein
MQGRSIVFVMLTLFGSGVSEDRGDTRPLASHPYAAFALPKAARHWVVGHVEERVPAGPYVYLRLREPSGAKAWLVSLSVTTPMATDVRARVVGRAERFHSRRLARDFSPLLFAAVRAAESPVERNP